MGNQVGNNGFVKYQPPFYLQNDSITKKVENQTETVTLSNNTTNKEDSYVSSKPNCRKRRKFPIPGELHTMQAGGDDGNRLPPICKRPTPPPKHTMQAGGDDGNRLPPICKRPTPPPKHTMQAGGDDGHHLPPICKRPTPPPKHTMEAGGDDGLTHNPIFGWVPTDSGIV